jgi:hypothetical protein
MNTQNDFMMTFLQQQKWAKDPAISVLKNFLDMRHAKRRRIVIISIVNKV